MSKERDLLRQALELFDWMEVESEVVEEIRAYLAAEEQYDALSEHYVEGLGNSMKACKESFEREAERVKELLAAESEADDILNRAITALESTTLEITNITAFRNGVIDECIEAVGLGICRDGRDTSHYQQSQRHLEALRKLKTKPEPSRKPLTEEEIASEFGIRSGTYFIEGVFAGIRFAEKHHGIGEER